MLHQFEFPQRLQLRMRYLRRPQSHDLVGAPARPKSFRLLLQVAGKGMMEGSVGSQATARLEPECFGQGRRSGVVGPSKDCSCA